MLRRWNIVWFLLAKTVVFGLLFSALAMAQSQLEVAVLRRTNIARAEHGLPPLEWDDNAASAARAHAQDMLERGYFAHETPEGLTVADRMWRAGVLEVTVGENIAYYEGYPSQEAVAKAVDDWMDSPHHRENILRPGFTHLGVGVVQRGDRIMLVQDFLERPFEVAVWQTPSSSQVDVIKYAGSSRATVGLFINGVFDRAMQPPRWSGELRLPVGSEVSLGLWREDKYYLACSFVPPEVSCSSPKIDWRASYRQELVKTSLLQITLPQGEYTLAHGLEKPIAFKKVGSTVNIEVPVDWGAVWIGVSSGSRVEYTHKIPLQRK